MIKQGVKTAKQYIDKNFASIKRIQAVPSALGLPYELLRKAFARDRGLPMQQYLEEVRVEAAKQKLLENKKLYAVAREIGYASETTLIKHFKKITGMTPRQYTKLFKDENL